MGKLAFPSMLFRPHPLFERRVLWPFLFYGCVNWGFEDSGNVFSETVASRKVKNLQEREESDSPHTFELGWLCLSSVQDTS